MNEQLKPVHTGEPRWGDYSELEWETMSPFSDLLQTICKTGGEWVGVMRIKAFLDASGGHGGEDRKGNKCPVAIIAGYFSSGYKWQEFEKKWPAFLSKYGITHLHTSDLFAGSKECAGWSESKKTDCLNDAITLVENTVMGGIIRAFNFEAFQSFVAKHPESEPAVKAAYYCNAILTLRAGADLAEQLKYNDSIHYVFEAGDLHQDDILRAHTSISRDKESSQFWRFREGALAFMPKKRLGALQVADMLANIYYKEKYREHYESHIQPFSRPEMVRLDKIPGDYIIHSDAVLEKFWTDMNEDGVMNK